MHITRVYAHHVHTAGYKSGVITNCTKSAIDHAVLMVGAGTTSEGVDYYIIKNSWGAKWGEHG